MPETTGNRSPGYGTGLSWLTLVILGLIGLAAIFGLAYLLSQQYH